MTTTIAGIAPARARSPLTLALLIAAITPAAAFQTPAHPAGAKLTCVVDETVPGEGDRALLSRKYADAERLYSATLAANPASVKAMAGLVRTNLEEDKLPEALALANTYNDAHPNDPRLLDALGEVRFRRGEVDEAAIAFNKSMHLDPCIGRTHYDVAGFLNLSGMYATAQRQLEFAHTFSPNDPEINRRWRSTHAVPLTPEQNVARLKVRLDNPSLSDDQKEGIEAAIKGIETSEKGSCELVSPVSEAKLPIVPISNGGAALPGDMYAAGLDIQFNGKRRRLEIDTGASGLLLTRSVAKAAGLVPELEMKAGGIGDNGPANAFVTHVDDIRIGGMEFKNCMVQVLEKSGVLDVDGLIGPDVFRDFLVTLDIPGREVRVGPLPPRPDDQHPATASLGAAGDQETQLSSADQARDRYIAPEMKDWTPIFRSGHFLIFPTLIGNAPVKLFMMDTGASLGMISPAAAREVTHVSGEDDMHVKGINGEVKNVFAADKVSITFGGVRQIIQGMTAFDNALLSRNIGVEISGLIGFPTLRELVISIDYRDNLVHVVYDPKKGYHAH